MKVSCSMNDGFSYTIKNAMADQIPTVNGWWCGHCRNYKGKLVCKQRVLICWTGANLSGCRFYQEERRKELFKEDGNGDLDI
jgi:hypothetical protein